MYSNNYEPKFYLSFLKAQFKKSEFVFITRRSPCNVVVNILDGEIAVIEFEPQLRYYVHFWTNTFGENMNSLLSSVLLQRWLLASNNQRGLTCY